MTIDFQCPGHRPSPEGKASSEELANGYENLDALFAFAERLATLEASQRFLGEALRRLRAVVQGDAVFLGATRELEIASEIQRSLLPPRFPVHARYEIFGLSESAPGAGGDYFNAIALPDGAVLFVIAEVRGGGLPAALRATVFRAAVQARLEAAARPAELLRQVHRQLCAELSALSLFIIAQFAWLSPNGLRLELASAGHGPALRLNGDEGEIEAIGSGGAPLVGGRDPRIDSRTVFLGEDDSLAFMTDGVYETANSRGQFLDFEGVMHYLFLHGPADARRLCRNLLEFVRLHAGGAVPADDRTLLIATPRHRHAPSL